MTCIELQFDSCIDDRLLILNFIGKLHSHVKNIKFKANLVLTWEFFINRFNALHVESQLVTDVLSPVDINGVSSNQRKINIAKLAMKKSDLIRAISSSLRLESLRGDVELTESAKNANDLDPESDLSDDEFSQSNSSKEQTNLEQKIAHVLISLLMKVSFVFIYLLNPTGYTSRPEKSYLKFQFLDF